MYAFVDDGGAGLGAVKQWRIVAQMLFKKKKALFVFKSMLM